MNGLNTIDVPTINGLKSLNLDSLTSSSINAGTIYMEYIETENILIDNDIIMNTGSKIITNETNISDVELSSLDNITGNIENRISSVENKTQDITYSLGLTTITNLRANELSSAEINTATIIADGITVHDSILYPDLNTQYYAFSDSLYDKLNDTTLINTSNKLNANLISNGVVDNNEFDFLNGLTSNIQEQFTSLQNKTANISTNGNSITLDTIYFNNLGYIDFIGTGTRQFKAFTDDLYNKLINTTLINSEYKLTPLLIGNGLINETEFNHLNGVTNNIQLQFNGLDSRIDTLENDNLDSRLTTLEEDNLDSRITTLEEDNLDSRITTLENYNLDSRITTLENNTLWLKYNLNISNLLNITPVSGTDYVGSHTYTTAPFGPGRFMITFILNLGPITRLMVMKSRLTLNNTTNGTYSTKWIGRNRDVVTSEEDYVYYSHSCFFNSNTTTSSISIETNYDVRAGTNMACSGTLEIIQI